jgi:hypothetical protein
MLLVSLMGIIEVYGEKEETNGEKGKREIKIMFDTTMSLCRVGMIHTKDEG